MDTDRLGIFLDLAHLACAWKQPAEALTGLRAAGLPTVEVPVPAAVEAPHPAGPVPREAFAALSARPVARCDHLDVETYTWGVLPQARRPRGDAETAPGTAAGPPFARDELAAFGPVLLCLDRAAIRPRVEVADVQALLLELAGPAWEAP